MNLDAKTIVTLASLLSGGGVIGVLIKSFMDKKKIDAEANQMNVKSDVAITESAMSYAKMLREDIERMKTEFDEDMDKMKEEYERKILRLTQNNESLMKNLDKLLAENELLRHKNDELETYNIKLEEKNHKMKAFIEMEGLEYKH